jgi:hypothetical protein
MYQAAVAQAQQITDEANSNFTDASNRASELLSEADRISRESQIQANTLLEDSQRTATNLINQSRRRAEMLSRKAETLANNAIRDSEERLVKMKAERGEIDEFLTSLKSLMSTESMVAADENTASEK